MPIDILNMIILVRRYFRFLSFSLLVFLHISLLLVLVGGICVVVCVHVLMFPFLSLLSLSLQPLALQLQYVYTSEQRTVVSCSLSSSGIFFVSQSVFFSAELMIYLVIEQCSCTLSFLNLLTVPIVTYTPISVKMHGMWWQMKRMCLSFLLLLYIYVSSFVYHIVWKIYYCWICCATQFHIYQFISLFYIYYPNSINNRTIKLISVDALFNLCESLKGWLCKTIPASQRAISKEQCKSWGAAFILTITHSRCCCWSTSLPSANYSWKPHSVIMGVEIQQKFF